MALKDLFNDTVNKLTRDANVTKWMSEIADARKREKSFIEQGRTCVSIYEQGKDKEVTPDYNILYSNTETLAPAILSALPRPLVKRRFSDANPVADAGARVVQNTLAYLIKCDEEGYSPFYDQVESARTEALVPGRGLTRFKLSGQVVGEVVMKELTVCGEEVPWDRIIFGYAKKWSKLPWIAFEHFLTRDELIQTFGETLGNQIPLNATPKEDDDKPNTMPADSEGCKFAHVYEIWDRRDRKVKFMSEGHPNLIKEVDDPLQLQGFFPLPKQMIFTSSISSMIPRPLYMMYQNQAHELDKITRRIGKITDALKVRGAYDTTIGADIERLLETAGDNEMIPASQVVALQDGKGLDSAIWLMPIEKLVTVLQQLYTNREAIKQVIYEITGIADIMRGSSKASETLGAQQIKAQWGTMRLKTYQNEVGRYVVDCLKIMAELACTKYTVESFKAITGVKLPMNAERQQAIQWMEQTKAQAQQAAQMGQQTQDPTQSPQWKQAEVIAKSPTWEEVLSFLQNDLHRNYAIQIETNSTLAEEMAEDREDLVQFMQAGAGFIQSVFGMVKEGVLDGEVGKEMILAICRKFRIGYELEDKIAAMKAPELPNQGMDPKVQAEIAILEQKLTFEKEMHEMDKQAKQMDIEFKQEELGVKKEELNLKREKAHLDGEIQRQTAEGKVQAAQATAQATVIKADAQAHAAVQQAQQPPAPTGAA